MRGILLAGGFGTRLHPLTLITNKHLLPVYNKPMILFPLETLKKSGIDEIMIVCGKEHAGHFMNFLGSGKDYDVKLSYAIQHGAGGIAEALGLTEDFVKGEQIAVVLGDNVFEDDFSKEVETFKNQDGAKIFVKEDNAPHRFAVIEIKGDKVVSIEEKPKEPKSNLVNVGFNLYNPDVFDKIRKLKPSWRNELEMTDVHNMYLQEGKLTCGFVKGFWSDTGTFDSLLETANWLAKRVNL